MEPIQAHARSILCLETSRTSMEQSNISLTNREILLSSSYDNQIHLWEVTMSKMNETVQLNHLYTIEQERNISLQTIQFLSMMDNFLLANFSDQAYLHLWQFINISISIDEQQRLGVVEHPTKGNHHRSRIQGNNDVAICINSIE
jgi:WD40 repeat protein